MIKNKTDNEWEDVFDEIWFYEESCLITGKNIQINAEHIGDVTSKLIPATKKFIQDLVIKERTKATRDEQIKCIDEKIELLNEIYNFSDNRPYLDDFLNDRIKELQNQKQQLLNS